MTKLINMRSIIFVAIICLNIVPQIQTRFHTSRRSGDVIYTDTDHGMYTTYRSGDCDYVNGPNGYSGTGRHVGDTYYYSDEYVSKNGGYIKENVGYSTSRRVDNSNYEYNQLSSYASPSKKRSYFR